MAQKFPSEVNAQQKNVHAFHQKTNTKCSQQFMHDHPTQSIAQMPINRMDNCEIKCDAALKRTHHSYMQQYI